MRSKQTNICFALALALSLAICNQSAKALSDNCTVVAIPETNFSDPNTLTYFDILLTEGYPAKLLTLNGGNVVGDFVESPAFVFDGPQPICSSQILADGSASYTKVIPFQKHFHLHFQVTNINPVPPYSFNPYGGTLFELHDTDPCFAQYGDPNTSAIRLDNASGVYNFYANDKLIWSGPMTTKVADRFELNGVLQENNSTLNDGKLELKRNGVVVATSTGPNTHSMTPNYPPPGPPPHALTSGPHIRLGLGKVPTPMNPNQLRVTSEVYVDNVGAAYSQ